MITYSSMLILLQGLFLSHFFLSTNGFSPSSLSAIKVTHLGLRFPPIKATRNVVYDTEGVVLDKKKDPYLKEEDGKEIDYVDAFCRWTNSAFRNLTIEPVRDFLEIIPAQTNMTFFEKLTTPPQYPGLPRPVSLTILASVPTALGWYGFYKFSVEEELFQDELRREGRVTGCGGYGTLLPFVFLFLFGGFFGILGAEDLSNDCLRLGGIWILAGQINLYRRVNELYTEKFQGEAPLHEWWALLPPPLDVVVGLRQVHFLAKYWSAVRNEEFEKDVFADGLFPFISSERFTLLEFVREPKRWFWFTSEYKDFDFDKIKRDVKDYIGK